MGYNSGTGVIPRDGSVTVTDIRRALDMENVSGVIGLVTEGGRTGKINKWSLYKPIRFTRRVTSLNDDEFIGQRTDTLSGIYYGVKFDAVAVDIADIHDTKFEYVYPSGNVLEPVRMGDFKGYSKNAVPDLSGAVSPDDGTIYKDLSVAVTLTVSYIKNSDGVPFSKIIDIMTDGRVGSFESCYPCIMVGDYARAMRLPSGELAPLGKLSGTRDYVVSLSEHPMYSSLSSERVSFFLYPYSLGDVFNLDGWNVCRGTVYSNRALPLPDLTGKVYAFRTYGVGITLTIGTVSLFRGSIFVPYTASTTSSEYEVKCTLTYNDDALTMVQTNGRVIGFSFNPSDFDAIFVSGVAYKFRVDMEARKIGSLVWGGAVSKEFMLTF